MKKKFNLKNKSTMMVIMIVVVLLAIAGIATYTYSFFAVTAQNTSTITGTAESLAVTVDVVQEGSTGKLIPQLSGTNGATLVKAIKGATGQSACVDGNANTVCHRYKVTIKNTGSVAALVTATVSIDKKSNTNLKWARYNGDTSSPALVNGVKDTSTTVAASMSFVTDEVFTAGQTKIFYFVVFIEEKSAAQTDTGKYSGTVYVTERATNG